MKIAYFIFAFLITVNLSAQDSIVFKPEFKANSIYETSMTMQTLMSSIQIKDSIKTDMPAMDMTMEFSLSQATGDMATNGSIPMIITYRNMNISNAGMPASAELNGITETFKGIKVFTHIINGSEITVDSIQGADNDPVVKQTMSQTIEQISNMVEFPEHALKIGDSFEQDLSQSSSISAQIPGSTIIMTYTLKEIKNNIASFDTSMFMKGEMGEMMTMTGDGSGRMTFDISKKYVNNSDILMKMIMDMKMGAEGMHMEMTMDQKMNIQLVE